MWSNTRSRPRLDFSAPSATGATVSNLGIVDPEIDPQADASTAIPAVGMLANTNQGSIINSFVSSEYWGAILNNSNITYAGGLVGDNSGLIAQSYVYGATIYATQYRRRSGRHQRSVRQDHRQLGTVRRQLDRVYPNTPTPLALPGWAAWQGSITG